MTVEPDSDPMELGFSDRVSRPYLFEVTVGFGNNLIEAWLANKEAKNRKLNIPDLREDIGLLNGLRAIKDQGEVSIRHLDDVIEQMQTLSPELRAAKFRSLTSALQLIDDRYGSDLGKVNIDDLPFSWYDGEPIPVEYGIGMAHEREYEAHVAGEIKLLHRLRDMEREIIRKTKDFVFKEGNSETESRLGLDLLSSFPIASDEDERLLVDLGFSNAGLYGSALALHRKTLIDPATGLLVPRGYMFERMMNDTYSQIPSGLSRKLMTIDVCSMKAGNSNIGEARVNEYLAAVARGVKKSLRSISDNTRSREGFGDIMYRNMSAYRPNGEGGDEIVVGMLIPNDRKIGALIAKRVMENVYREQLDIFRS